MVTEAALGTAAIAGAAEAAGGTAAAVGGAGAAAGATGASAGAAGAASGATASGAAASGASAGATGASVGGAEAASGAGATAGTAGATGSAVAEGSGEAGSATGEAISGTEAGTEEGGKKGFKEWSDNVLNKYNELHGGSGDEWGKMDTWEKVGRTFGNLGTDKALVEGAIKEITPPTAPTNQQSLSGQMQMAQPISSDERLKDIEAKDLDPIDCFAQIDSYLYRYKPGVVDAYNGQEKGSPVNDEQNFGVMAQDLQANPLTRAAVEEDNNGYLMLDGGRLSSINTAMIAELCKKVKELEEYIYGR